MRAVVVGAGAVGARAGRHLCSNEDLERLTVVEHDPVRAQAVVGALGPMAQAAVWSPELAAEADVVVLAVPQGYRELAEVALEQGCHVVSVTDATAEVRDLSGLDAEARERSVSVVIGAGLSPGLACLLARHAAAELDTVDEIHIAKVGTGGPSCARQHHRALVGDALDWRDGAWVRRRGGSGRELCWFPDPVGGKDCYRGGLPEALLLVPAFPGVQRVTARMAATRRDRITAHVPMLRAPHPEGNLGAVRVEVRGRRGAASDARVLGVVDRPAVAAGAVAGVAARWSYERRMSRLGAGGLAELVPEPVSFLQELARLGIKAATFEGTGG